jgi:predicted enzyme related to lactoylglutathione lyase
MNNPVGWFEIYVQDMERAKAFYEAVPEKRFQPNGDA